MYDECPQVSIQLLVSDTSKLSTTSLQSLTNIDAHIRNNDYNNNTTVRSTSLLLYLNIKFKGALSHFRILLSILLIS